MSEKLEISLMETSAVALILVALDCLNIIFSELF